MYSQPGVAMMESGREHNAREDIEAEVRILVLVRKIGKCQNNLLPVRDLRGRESEGNSGEG